MSDIIKLLPDSVANQIAAGEVIQRPASVIKELVENSIDAGASEVEIILKDAGRTLIQVIDNGKGMSDTDARLAFERHSTSKIRSAEDLFTLHTMGFRGEALASIAAISQMELRTARKEDEIGTKLIVIASKCESQEPDVCAPGCNFAVKNIFFNVPARRKFLKSNPVELSNIIKEFEKLALVNSNVSFTLTHNDNVQYQLMAGTFKQRIISIFGRSLESQLIPLNIETSLIKIEGFICRPENSRKRNAYQFFFVNGRYMRHPYFHKAVLSSYGELIPDDEQPHYFLNFTVDPQAIDVNIHPTKTEIKFENEVPIWQILSAAIKEALGRFSAVPSIDFDTEGAPSLPAYTKERNFNEPEIDLDPSYNPFKKSGEGGAKCYESKALKDWDNLYANFAKSKIGMETVVDEADFGTEDIEITTTASKLNDSKGELNLIADDYTKNIQLNCRYIVSPISSGLMIIDQHRAHLRILYDRYIAQLSSNSVVSQRVMFPEVIQLTASQHVILEEIENVMSRMGYNLSQLGGCDWSIIGIPTGLDGVDAKVVVMNIISAFENGGEDFVTKSYENIALSTAKSGAIPYGRALSVKEMDTLISDLMRLPQPNFTPDGKTVINIMKIEQINKIFS